MKATVALLLALLLLAAAAAAAAPSVGNPVVYHSTDGGLTASQGIDAQDDQPLHLYLDYDNQPDVGFTNDSQLTMCVDGDGDETCAFDVKLEMTTDTATFDSFTPGGVGIVGHIEDPERTTFRVNGIATEGMTIPAFIGTLTVDALGANQVQIQAVGRHRVGAAGQLDAIQPQVVALPEPGRGLLLASGLLALAALHRLRQWLRSGA